MRNVFSGYFFRVIVVVSLLALVGLVSVDIWLWQRDDGSSRLTGAGPGVQDGFQVPGLPARNTTGGAGDSSVVAASSGASASDSAELEVRRAGAAPGQVEIIQIEGADGAASELTVGDEVTANDSAESEVQQEQTPAPSGGSGDAASVEDSVDLVVRDAAGNIKQQETVK